MSYTSKDIEKFNASISCIWRTLHIYIRKIRCRQPSLSACLGLLSIMTPWSKTTRPAGYISERTMVFLRHTTWLFKTIDILRALYLITSRHAVIIFLYGQFSRRFLMPNMKLTSLYLPMQARLVIQHLSSHAAWTSVRSWKYMCGGIEYFIKLHVARP